MKSIFFKNLLLKIISLMLAIITWIYINGELSKKF